MANRKISECISVRINVGNYQHIELTKYAEESIDYKSEKDRIAQEDTLRDELVQSLVRSMKAIPEKLGKGIEEAIEVEEAIKKAIPEWLANSPVPNIANSAEKKQIQNAAEQKNQKDEAESNLSEVTSAPEEKEVKKEATQEELFEDDEMPEPEKVEGADEPEETEETEETTSEEKKEPVAAGGELDDFFGSDDDLFGDD